VSTMSLAWALPREASAMTEAIRVFFMEGPLTMGGRG
jgi:hypothetical protein